jgi:hypothetical protein
VRGSWPLQGLVGQECRFLLAISREFGGLAGVDAGGELVGVAVEHFCENDPVVAIEAGAAALVAHACHQLGELTAGADTRSATLPGSCRSTAGFLPGTQRLDC